MYTILLGAGPGVAPQVDLNVGRVEDFVFSPDSASLVVLGDRATSVVDPATFNLRARIDVPVQNNRILFSYDGETVALAPCEVHLVRLKAASPPVVLQCEGEGQARCVRALIFAPAKPELWMACPDGKVLRRSVRDGKLLATAVSLPGTSEAHGGAADWTTGARIVPSYRNGEPNGFKLFSIKEGSIFARIGLQDGDVLTKIAGRPLTKPDEALALFQQLSDNQGTLEVELQRRGEPVILTVTPSPAGAAATGSPR